MKEFKRAATLLLPDMTLSQQELKNNLPGFKQLEGRTKYMKQQLSDTEQQALRTVTLERETNQVSRSIA